jgi:hypothetical protein
VLILRNTIKKKRVTDASHKENLQQQEENNTLKLIESQKHEIKSLESRVG